MSENRLRDYLDHMRQAASDACGFVEGMDKSDFMQDKRTQQAVVMSLIVIGEAATKVMDADPGFVERVIDKTGAVKAARTAAAPNIRCTEVFVCFADNGITRCAAARG